jgi:DDE family transposase
VLYLGEVNDSQREAWCRVIEAFDEDTQRCTHLALFPAHRELPEHAKDYGVQVRLDAMELHRPRQWGACWLACLIVAKALVGGTFCRRWWFTACSIPAANGACTGYGLNKAPWAIYSARTIRWWRRMRCIVVSTRCCPYGYSRDKRSDCVQVVIALIVTPEGFPIAYEVLPGNTADKTTLKMFLQKIEAQYGRAERVWVMDRGILTAEVLKEMRAADPPVYYLVDTPKGRLTQLERDLLPLPWATVRPGINVKLLPQEGELYVFTESRGRLHKERAMRRRQLKGLVKRLKQLQQMKFNNTRQLLLKLGEAKGRYRAAWRLIEVVLPQAVASSASPESAAPDTRAQPRFSFRLNRKKLREVRRREGRYLLRTNLCGRDPEDLWQFYIQLTEVEAAFKNLQDDLQLRPIYYQLESRIEAHLFVAFMAYCRLITLRARLKPLAAGLTSRAVLDKLAGIQMLEAHFPTSDAAP